MTIEEAIQVLKKDRDLCLFDPKTGKRKPMNEDCLRSADAYDTILKELERMTINRTIQASGYKMSDNARIAVVLFTGYLNGHLAKRWWLMLWCMLNRGDLMNDDAVKFVKGSVLLAYKDLETQYPGLTIFFKNALTNYPTTVKNYILDVLGWSDSMKRSPISGAQLFFKQLLRVFDDSFADLFSVISEQEG